MAERQLCYILDGEMVVPATTREWATWLGASRDRRTVGRTRLPGGEEVSTVFLGLDHNFGDGPPLLFETMVFGGEQDQFMRRYATIAEARLGHEETVRTALAGIGSQAKDGA